MENIANKSNDTVGATGELTASEYNDHKNELQGAVTRSGQTLSGGTLLQLSKALFINGVGAASVLDSGSGNTIQLSPRTGGSGLVVPDAYSHLQGAVLQFDKVTANTLTAVTVNFGQTGTELGAKPLVRLDGTLPLAGDIKGLCTIIWDNSADKWFILSNGADTYGYAIAATGTVNPKFQNNIITSDTSGGVNVVTVGAPLYIGQSATVLCDGASNTEVTYPGKQESGNVVLSDGGSFDITAVSATEWRSNISDEAASRKAGDLGFDNTNIKATSATQVTVQPGGTLDVSGSIVTAASTVLALGAVDTDYFIKRSGGTFVIQTGPGVFDPAKNALYDGGERILNWIVRRDATTVSVSKIINPEALTAVDQSVRHSRSLTVKEIIAKSGLSTGEILYNSGLGHFIRLLDDSGASKMTLRSWTPTNGIQLNLDAGGVKTVGDIITSSGNIIQDTLDGADTKEIQIGGGGAIDQSRGGSVRIFGNEDPIFPGGVTIYPGAVAGSYIRIYTSDDLTNSLAVQIDDASGMVVNRPFLPTSTPVVHSQVVAGLSSFILPRGEYNIGIPVPTAVGTTFVFDNQLTFFSQLGIRSNPSSDKDTVGVSVHANGINVGISNDSANAVTFEYTKY